MLRGFTQKGGPGVFHCATKCPFSRSELNSFSSWLGATRLCEEFSSVRIQLGNTTIRVKLTFDLARCDQAPRRVQPASSNQTPQTLAGFVAQTFCGSVASFGKFMAQRPANCCGASGLPSTLHSGRSRATQSNLQRNDASTFFSLAFGEFADTFALGRSL